MKRVSFITTTMIEEWKYSAENLIYHFRAILRGMIPFAQTWELENGNKARADLDEHAFAFIQSIAQMAHTRRELLPPDSQHGSLTTSCLRR